MTHRYRSIPPDFRTVSFSFIGQLPGLEKTAGLKRNVLPVIYYSFLKSGKSCPARYVFFSRMSYCFFGEDQYCNKQNDVLAAEDEANCAARARFESG